MKIKSLLRTGALLFASSFLTSLSSNAQDSLIPYIALASDPSAAINTNDLSGFYLIQSADGSYLTPFQARTGGDFAELCMNKKNWALQLIKDGNFYTINWGDKLANYQHNWNSGFGTLITDPSYTQWAIEAVGGNQVKIKRSTEEKYMKAEPNAKEGIILTKIYSDANGTDAISLLTLIKVTEKRPAVIPVANNTIKYEATSTLNSNDLSGKYVIKTSTGGFMSTEYDSIYSSATTVAAYTFDFAKQSNGTYIISSGDLQANFMDPTNLGFDAKIDTTNTWDIFVQEDNTVTFQRTSDALYLSNEVNPRNGGFKFLVNNDGLGDVYFTLHKAIITSAKNVSKGIESTIIQNGSQLTIANASNLKAVAIYNITGQKVYDAKVSSSSLNIPVSSWIKGVYLVKFTGNNGNYKSVKTIVK